MYFAVCEVVAHATCAGVPPQSGFAPLPQTPITTVPSAQFASEPHAPAEPPASLAWKTTFLTISAVPSGLTVVVSARPCVTTTRDDSNTSTRLVGDRIFEIMLILDAPNFVKTLTTINPIWIARRFGVPLLMLHGTNGTSSTNFQHRGAGGKSVEPCSGRAKLCFHATIGWPKRSTQAFKNRGAC